MRINDTNLGGGLYRLDVEATSPWENVYTIPTCAMDNIMRDVIKQKKATTPCSCRPSRPCPPKNPLVWGTDAFRSVLEPQREPDGIDVHVDRPLRQNFTSHARWAEAMAKYRTLEDVAKDCDWKCREPMKGAPTCCTAPARQPKSCCKPTPCNKPIACNDDIIALAIAVLADIL